MVGNTKVLQEDEHMLLYMARRAFIYVHVLRHGTDDVRSQQLDQKVRGTFAHTCVCSNPVRRTPPAREAKS